jgi:hypothetical protein
VDKQLTEAIAALYELVLEKEMIVQISKSLTQKDWLKRTRDLKSSQFSLAATAILISVEKL